MVGLYIYFGDCILESGVDKLELCFFVSEFLYLGLHELDECFAVQASHCLIVNLLDFLIINV